MRRNNLGSAADPNHAKHTAQTVAAIIRQNIEPDTADEVLAALQALDGEMIGPRMLDELPGGRVEWRLIRSLGWTEVRNRLYIKSGGKEGVSLVLARSEKRVPINAAFIERENPNFFKHRRARNELRQKALADTDLLERLASLFNEIEDLNNRCTIARIKFGVFVREGEPCSPDSTELARACGLAALVRE